MKLLLAALTVLPVLPAAARLLEERALQPGGFGTIIEHHQDKLCLWIGDDPAHILELRTCPSTTDVGNDNYEEK